MSERFLVTGALGCIGSWVIRQLLAEGVNVVAFDPGSDQRRLDYLIDESTRPLLRLEPGDVTDLAQVQRALDVHGITNVVHLAALQVPFCRATPVLGAQVNVVGTVNIFEAVKQRNTIKAPVVYASSVATFDEVEEGLAAPLHPAGYAGTHYGVYKRANEGTAHVYRRDEGVSSLGLRPYVVYGVGRDQGMTAEPTHAVLCAVAGVPYKISYGGRTQMQYAQDVAAAFVAASRSGHDGADVYNLGGASHHMSEIVESIERAVPESTGLITYVPDPLPFPDEVDPAGLETVVGELPTTPLSEGIAETAHLFRELLAQHRIEAPRGVPVS